MYTIYINNTLPPALAVHEIYRDIFGPPMIKLLESSFLCYSERFDSIVLAHFSELNGNFCRGFYLQLNKIMSMRSNFNKHACSVSAFRIKPAARVSKYPKT